ncbi:hypothetical protein Glove_421g57 [Diversispora epigaea]|uniref:Uncharacterized protein n=1 Tax=Diversispora epigaea TaxID=1348612 RepID=A0A397H3K2_9GLOM|nr:hypothetical protein Glove_421g57 [Diversispora epigaea]
MKILKYINGEIVNIENVETSRNNFKDFENFCSVIITNYTNLIFDALHFKNAWNWYWCLEQSQTLQEILDKQLESAIYGISNFATNNNFSSRISYPYDRKKIANMHQNSGIF